MGDPRELAARLSATPGVIDHGLFAPEMVSLILIAGEDGVDRRAGAKPDGSRRRNGAAARWSRRRGAAARGYGAEVVCCWALVDVLDDGADEDPVDRQLFAFLELVELEQLRPALPSSTSLRRRAGGECGKLLSAPVADRDVVSVSQDVRGWVRERLPVHVEVELVAAVAGEPADLRGPELDPPQ